MANFVRSFSEGFDVGNKVIDTMDRRERLEKYDERQQTLQNREDTQWEQGQEAYTHGLERRGVEEQQKDEAHELGVKQTKKSMSLADAAEERAKKQEERNQETYNAEVDERNFQAADRTIRLAWQNAIATGDPSPLRSPEVMEIVSKYSVLDGVDRSKPENVKIAGKGLNILRGISSGQKLPSHDDPDLISVANLLYGGLIDRPGLPSTTPSGKQIKSREISAIIPAEGVNPPSFAIQIKVTDEDGESYMAPLTNGRTSKDNDNVRLISMPDMVSQLHNIVKVQNDKDIQKITSLYNARYGESKKTKPNLQKEQYAAENKIDEDYRKQLADLDGRMDLEPKQKKERKIEIEQARERDLARVRLRASNILGGNGGGLVNFEGQQREKKITQTMDLFKQAFPKIEFTPELNAKIRSAIDQGKDQEWISGYIADYANSQDSNTTKPNQSQSENADEIRGWIYDQRGQGSRSKYSETPTNLSAKERAGLARYATEGESTSKSYRPEDIPKGNDARTGRGLDAIQMWNN